MISSAIGGASNEATCVELSKAEGERIMECFNTPVDVEPDKREMTP